MATKQEMLAKMIAMLLDPDAGSTLGFVVSGFGTIATGLGWRAVRALVKMGGSVVTLNTNIATILKEVDEHRRTLNDHEARLRVREIVGNQDEGAKS